MTGEGIAGGHAFISYVREDSGQVDQLQQLLEAAGIKVWRDTADLWPGEDWRSKIRNAITENALVFIACFSTKSVARAKSYQRAELSLAIEQLILRPRDVPWLIPVRFDNCTVPDDDIGGNRTLASIQRADLFGDRADEDARRLVEIVLRLLGPGRDTRAAGPPMGGAGADPETAARRFTIARNPAAGTAPGPGPVLPEPRRRHVKVILGAAALLAAGTAVASWFLIGPGRNGGVRIPLTVNTCAGVARVPSAAVRLGTLPTGRPGVTNGNNNDYVGATFAPDCHLMAAAGNGQERILNLVAGLQTATLPVNRGHWVFGAAFTPDSKTLAVASNDGVTELWDVTSGQQLVSLPTDPNGGTWGLALSPDGKTLVTGGSDGLVEFWNVATHTQIRQIPVPGIGSLAISPNGKLVAVGGAQDGIERLLSLHTGTQLTTLNSHAGNAFSVAFSPDSRTLAVATSSGVQWWDISSGKLIAQETGAADDVVFSPDGKVLAVGGKDSVVLRDASTHRAIATLRLGSAGAWVTGMAFSRYGGVLAVGWNGTLQFWNVAGVSRLT
jgi:TIR domain/WD domain, G-beta repeat